MLLSDWKLTKEEQYRAFYEEQESRLEHCMESLAHAQRRKLATYLIQRSEQMYGDGNMTARWLMEEFHNLEPWPDPEPTGEGD